MVAIAYERGKAINMASLVELDAVIDPAEPAKPLLPQVRRGVPALGQARRPSLPRSRGGGAARIDARMVNTLSWARMWRA
jgi:hypothetical protein